MSPSQEKLEPYGNAVAIKADWYDAKKEGIQVGEPIFVRQWWVPVLWHDNEDLDFFKAAGLDGVVRAPASARSVLVDAVVEAAKKPCRCSNHALGNLLKHRQGCHVGFRLAALRAHDESRARV